MSKKISKYLLFFILCITIGLSAFYSAEGFDLYTMKTALINTNTNHGKMYTIDTDGNFNEQINSVEVSSMATDILPIIGRDTITPIQYQNKDPLTTGLINSDPQLFNAYKNTTKPNTTAPAAATVVGSPPSIFANGFGTQGLIT